MNSSAAMGPVQLAGLTYLIAGFVSFGVAGVIKLLFGIIKLQKDRVLTKAIVADHSVMTKPVKAER